MTKDIIIAISFVIFIMVLCFAWNIFVKKMYVDKIERISFSIGNILDDFSTFDLVGTGCDLNSDFDVAKAIKKVEIADKLRIKVYE